MTTLKSKHKNDLSHIDNLADLKKEQRLVKARLKLHEETLTEQWQKLPAETFKLAVRKVVPFYLNNKVLDKSWSLVSGAVGLFNASNKKAAGKEVLGTAKKLGMFTAVRALYNIFKKKK